MPLRLRLKPQSGEAVSLTRADERPSRMIHLARAGLGEIRFDPRKTMASAVSRTLPQFSFNRSRTLLLRAMGFRIGAGSVVMGPLDVTGDTSTRLISIGEQTKISGPLRIDIGAHVRIGNRVTIGHHVVLFTVDHEVGPSEQRCGRPVSGPIVIEDGAWIASYVKILPGITIG